MTQPIQEPSTDRALQGMAYARDQIFRRPAPVTSDSVSFGRAQAQISSSAIDFVEPDFVTGSGATFQRTDDGRFHINADERFVLEQGNTGCYEISVNVFDISSVTNNEDNWAQILLNFVAPVPSGAWWLPGWFETGLDTSAYEMTFPWFTDADNQNFDEVPGPWSHLLYLEESDEDLVFRLRCALLHNNTQYAATMNVILSVTRIGNATIAVETGPPFS